MRKARRSREKPAPRRVAVTPPAPRRRSGSRSRFEQLLRVDLAAAALDALEQLALDGGDLLDLFAEAIGVAELLPRGLEREGDGRVGGPAQVVRGDRAQRLEGGLGEEGTEGARVFALPALELEEEGGGEDELDAVLHLASEDHAAGEQGLEADRERGHLERAARLGDAVEQLAARGREPRGVAHVGETHQRARRLRRGVDALARVDPDPHAGDERVQLGLRERAQDDVEPPRRRLDAFALVLTAARRRDPLPGRGRSPLGCVSRSVVDHAHSPVGPAHSRVKRLSNGVGEATNLAPARARKHAKVPYGHRGRAGHRRTDTGSAHAPAPRGLAAWAPAPLRPGDHGGTRPQADERVARGAGAAFCSRVCAGTGNGPVSPGPRALPLSGADFTSSLE